MGNVDAGEMDFGGQRSLERNPSRNTKADARYQAKSLAALSSWISRVNGVKSEKGITKYSRESSEKC